MRTRFVLLLIALMALALVLTPSAGAGNNFVAPLSGAQEVPARDTNAAGVATFKLSKDGTALEFKVNVANIDNVVRGAHPLRRRRGQRPCRGHAFRGGSRRGSCERHPRGGHDYRPRRRQRMRMDQPGRGPGSDQQRQHLRQRPHQRWRGPAEHRPGRLPRRGDPRPDQITKPVARRVPGAVRRSDGCLSPVRVACGLRLLRLAGELLAPSHSTSLTSKPPPAGRSPAPPRSPRMRAT